MSDVSIYIRDVPPSRLRKWAEKFLGPLRPVYGAEGSGNVIYHADAEGKSGLVLASGFGGGAYIEVTLNSETLPWREDYEIFPGGAETE